MEERDGRTEAGRRASEPDAREPLGRPLPRAGRRKSTLSHISVDRRVVLTVNEHEKVSLGEFIEKIGFGAYQLQVFGMSFGALMVETAIIAMVSGCVNPISKEFLIESTLGKAGLTSLLYLGIQIGTAVVGSFIDRFGRRRPLLVGYFGMVIFGICSCFSPGVKTLYAMLFLMGFFGGLSVPCAVITLSEVVPAAYRGSCSAALGVGFRFGALWSAIALRIWMPELDSGPWRWLIGMSIIPAAVFLLWSLFSPAARQDTPHFLAISGQGRSVVSTLNLMAEVNGQQDLRLVHSEDVQLDRHANSVTVGEVVRMMSTYPLWLNFTVLTVLFFCKEFVAGGTTAYWPVTFAHLPKEGIQAIEDIRAKVGPSHFPRPALFTQLLLFEESHMTAATELIITALVSFPGIAVAMWVMHSLERRKSLALGASVTGVGGLLLLNLYGSAPWLGVVGVGIIQLFFPTWQMVTMLLASEVFPTQVRGQAYSSSFFLGRFGSEVAQLAVHSGAAVFPTIVAALAVFALTLVYSLPETKDTELTNFVSEVQKPVGGQSVQSYGAAGGAAIAGADADKAV